MKMTELLELAAETVEKNCYLSDQVRLDELPEAGGLYVEIGSGYNETVYYDRSAVKLIPIVFMAKHVRQQDCMDELTTICEYLQSLKVYPKAETFVWLDAGVATWPIKVGRNEDGQYIYSCIVNCRIF